MSCAGVDGPRALETQAGLHHGKQWSVYCRISLCICNCLSVMCRVRMPLLVDADLQNFPHLQTDSGSVSHEVLWMRTDTDHIPSVHWREFPSITAKIH